MGSIDDAQSPPRLWIMQWPKSTPTWGARDSVVEWLVVDNQRARDGENVARDDGPKMWGKRPPKPNRNYVFRSIKLATYYVSHSSCNLLRILEWPWLEQYATKHASSTFPILSKHPIHFATNLQPYLLKMCSFYNLFSNSKHVFG